MKNINELVESIQAGFGNDIEPIIEGRSWTDTECLDVVSDLPCLPDENLVYVFPRILLYLARQLNSRRDGMLDYTQELKQSFHYFVEFLQVEPFEGEIFGGAIDDDYEELILPRITLFRSWSKPRKKSIVDFLLFLDTISLPEEILNLYIIGEFQKAIKWWKLSIEAGTP